jgi:hypothetical protein
MTSISGTSAPVRRRTVRVTPQLERLKTFERARGTYKTAIRRYIQLIDFTKYVCAVAVVIAAELGVAWAFNVLRQPALFAIPVLLFAAALFAWNRALAARPAIESARRSFETVRASVGAAFDN